MYRPSFAVVTTVATVLCFLALFTLVMGPRIPPRADNGMGNAHDDFLRDAQYESVNWMPFNSSVITAAQRSERPILLTIGTPCSQIGQYLDRVTFTDPELSAYLDSRFVCARIDGAIHPEWLNAMLPFSRLESPFRSDIQMWALDTSGHAYDAILHTEPADDFSPNGILPRLVEIRGEFNSPTPTGISSAVAQRDETRLLAAEARQGGVLARNPTAERGVAASSFSLYSAVIESLGERSAVGFPVKGRLGIRPQIWRYLVATGDRTTFDHAVVHGVLHSPLTDLLDGGFFRAMSAGADRTVDFEKEAVENANAMLALAEADAVWQLPIAHRIAETTWDYIETTARGAGGFVEGQPGELPTVLRSPRYSVSNVRLRNSLPAGLRDWARSSLGLDVVAHPQAVPYLAADVLFDPRFETVIDDLRRTALPPPSPADWGAADISLTCAARGIEVARIWRDRDRLARALQWLAPLRQLLNRREVMRRLSDRAEGRGYLGDYLAYADAMLQSFLATGNTADFRLGLDVLRRAKALFGRYERGVWVLDRPDELMLVRHTSVPEVADNLHESCSARAVRLLMDYGRLLGPAQGGSLVAEAKAIVETLRPLALGGGILTAGIMCASASVYDNRFAVAVGPDALSLANSLGATLPTRLVAPVGDVVRPDLRRRAPGIYIVGDSVLGPLTPSAARRALSPVFDVVKPGQMRAFTPTDQP